MNYTSNRSATLCRWTGRVTGTLLVLVIVMIAIGEGMPNPFTQPLPIQFGFFTLALLLGGILAGWRWELAGAIISLAGFCMFVVVVVNSPRGLTPFVFALALPGVLYLTSALSRRSHARHLTARE